MGHGQAFSGGVRPISEAEGFMNLRDGYQRSVLNGPQSPKTPPRQTRDINRHFNQHLPENEPQNKDPVNIISFNVYGAF